MKKAKAFGILIAMICLFAHCSSNSESGVNVATYREAMGKYDTAVNTVISAITDLGESTAQFNTATTLDDMETADLYADRQSAAVDDLLTSLNKLETLENTLQGTDSKEEGMITQPLIFTLGVGLVIYGTYKFGQKMKSLSDKVSEERVKRDDAIERMANGDKTAEEDYKSAKTEMNTAGEEAVKEFGSKVTTDLILTPVNPTTVGGLIIKEKVGDLVQEGVKVITANGDCGDRESGTCRIAVQKTDSTGRASLPAGNQSVLISKPGKARITVDNITVTEGMDTQIIVEFVPVDEALPEGGNSKEEDSETDDSTSSTDAVGPKCAELAACCPKVDEPLALKEQCEDIVARNRETDCGILLAGSLGMYYCRE